MRKVILLLAAAIMFLCGVLAPVYATAATIQLCNTSGETAQQCLAEIQNISSNLSGDYVLNMDVILPAVTPLTTFTPIGNDTAPFTGTFDGQNHVIANLQVVKTGNFVGLFGAMTGVVQNLSLFNVNISGANGAVGILAGDNNAGTIQHVLLRNTSVVASGDEVGGLVGVNGGLVTDCHAVDGVQVSGNIFVGGLVGFNQTPEASSGNNSVEISKSSANATVSGADNVGGLVGQLDSGGGINQSYSEGSVTGTGEFIGGLAGGNDEFQTIIDCYSRASVTGVDHVGGLAGDNLGEIERTYSSGLVVGTGTGVGGLIGAQTSPATTQSSYWDTQTSGQAISAGGAGAMGKLTAEMKQQATYSGWNFSTIWHIFSGDYPVLAVHTKEITLSGTAYLDQGTTPVPVGTIVGLYINGPGGALKQTTLSTIGGSFSFNVNTDELSSGQTFLLYLIDPTPEGNAVFVPNNDTSDISGINILANRVYVYSSTPITSATFNTAKGTLTNDVLFDICSCGQVDFNVPQLDLDSTGNVNIGGLIGSATDRMAIAKLIYLKNLPIPNGKLQMMNSIDLSAVTHPASP